MSEFAHLSVHTEYSIIDSIVRIKELARAAKSKGITAVALTDDANLFGHWKFQSHLRDEGVKPIFGVDMQVTEDEQTRNRLILLAQNNEGMNSLRRLMTLAYTESKIHGCISLEHLQSQSEGLIALSGGIHSTLGQAILNDNEALTRSTINTFQALLGDRFYIELTRVGLDGEEKYIENAVVLAHELSVPVVATNDVRFLNEDEFDIHEIRYCIANKKMVGDNSHNKFYTKKQYLRSPAEMQKLFADYPDSITNACEIAKRCTVEISSKRYLPKFQTQREETPEQIIESVAHELFEKKLEQYSASHAKRVDRKQYQERLKKELAVINDMGFAGYFLIVGDFVSWAKRHGIPVGPGRGSGSASLVAFALGITDIDPIEHDLMFERLLNPERVSMPDFDIDFCMNRRNEVIEYVTQLYGTDTVAQIISFNTLGSKMAVRDVARTLGKTYSQGERIARLIPNRGAAPLPLSEALSEVPEFKALVESDPEVAELTEKSLAVEGLIRNRGRHAGGVVIAPTTLDAYVPIYTESNSGEVITQLDKTDVEALGLVKFDFLGLKTVTVIASACESINADANGKSKVDPLTIPLDDAKVFQSLHNGDTTGVFQLESFGMRQKLRELRPTCLEDLIALVALFRPGPLDTGVTDRYIRRKHGDETVSYYHPIHEKVLAKTYGLMVYQEDVMNLARELAGFSMGEADTLRSAMGKKNEEIMIELQSKFVDGCSNNNISEQIANEIFEDMRKFAGYAFNRAHAVGYAIVAYQTAYLRTYYPSEFLSALANSDDKESIKFYVEEAKRLQLTVKRPSINESGWGCIGKGKGMIVGYCAIKGFPHDDATRIERARKDGPFSSIQDLCTRAKLFRRHQPSLEKLIWCGALDCLCSNGKPIQQSRAEFLSLAKTVTHQAEQQSQRESDQTLDLFGSDETENNELSAKNVAPIRLHTMLLKEGDLLGFYISGHPIESYREELKQLCTYHDLTKLETVSLDKEFTVAGLVKSCKNTETRNGRRLTRIYLEDEHGSRELVMFEEDEHFPKSVVPGSIVVARCQTTRDKETKERRVQTRGIAALDTVRIKHHACVQIDMGNCGQKSDLLRELNSILGTWKHKGSPIHLTYRAGEYNVIMELGDRWRVRPAPELIDELEQLFGSRYVRVSYPST